MDETPDPHHTMQAARDASKVSQNLQNLLLILKFRAEQFPNAFAAPV